MKKIWMAFLLVGCTGAGWVAPDNFNYVPVDTDKYQIATWQKISNPKNNEIHIYIEGDGNAYDNYGQPTDNPTPRGKMLRELAIKDEFPNVVYMARPCQFIMNEKCSITDWTDGRFSQKIIDSVTQAINKTAGKKQITLIGYSGGAMVSGLVIKQNQNMKIKKWITIAGVLNHKKWTEYFGDKPLKKSLDMEGLPEILQTHFVGDDDETVPYELVKQWANEKDIRFVPGASHDDFSNINLFK